MKMVLRSLYLDPEIDGLLDARAEDEGITKAELMRRFLADGLARPSTTAAALIAKVEAVGRAAKAEATRARDAKPAKPAAKDKIIEIPKRRAVASNRR